jgi:CubicO group peptidase (beta-lactamase class C family)
MSATKAWGGLATGYETSFPSLVNKPTLLPKVDATMHAAGGIVTNANDLARWLEANLRDGRIGRKQDVPAAAVQETHKQQVTFADKTFYKYRQYAYGFGWYWGEYGGELLMHHLGGYDGWCAHISYMPQQNIGVAVVTNNNGAGSEVTSLVATYVYNLLLNRPGFDRTYAERIAELRKSISERTARVQANLDQRAKRTWMLAKPLDVYTGRYASTDYGTLVIRREGDKLTASLGQLHAPLEAFTKPETARVELIPGTGDVLAFTFSEGGEHPASVTWGDAPFTRVGGL